MVLSLRTEQNSINSIYFGGDDVFVVTAVMDFAALNKICASKFVDSEKSFWNRWKRQQKLLTAGELRHRGRVNMM